MKIQRFWESTQSNDLLIIKDYFLSFTEDLNDICSTNFSKINDNFFEVSIRFIGDTNTQIKKESNLNKLDHWVDMNEIDNKVLNELRSSMRALVDDDMLEEFELTKRIHGYDIVIHTKIKSDVTEWIYTKDYEIYHDKNRLKKILKDKFGVEVEDSYMSIEYIEDESYMDFVINLKTPIDKLKVDKIKSFILDIQIVDEDEEEIKPFTRGYFNQQSFHFIINPREFIGAR